MLGMYRFANHDLPEPLSLAVDIFGFFDKGGGTSPC
jgi:hypothetical protein